MAMSACCIGRGLHSHVRAGPLSVAVVEIISLHIPWQTLADVQQDRKYASQLHMDINCVLVNVHKHRMFESFSY